jgi:hypothetical protein
VWVTVGRGESDRLVRGGLRLLVVGDGQGDQGVGPREAPAGEREPLQLDRCVEVGAGEAVLEVDPVCGLQPAESVVEGRSVDVEDGRGA